MKFVNLKPKTVHTKFTGFIQPGKAVEGNRSSHRFAQVLEEVVGSCGHMIGLVLSPVEMDLVNKILKLNRDGTEFDPSSIPEAVRNDPTGEKRAADKRSDQQYRETGELQEKNRASAQREAIINGEIEERRPEGLATMQGEPVDASMLKSGFDKIMEENARIAAGLETKTEHDVEGILDPIGRHVKKDRDESPAPHEAGSGSDAVLSRGAFHDPEDATRTADAKEPEVQTLAGAGEMDKQAAKMARTLSSLSVFNDPDKAPKPDMQAKENDAPKAKAAKKKSKKSAK